MLQQITALSLSLFLLAGCGDSGVQQISGVPAPAPAVGVNSRLLSGVWGGYFPGSSIQKPDHGVEFHFDAPLRQDGSILSGGFVHRPNREGTRHDLTVEREGDQVTITLGKGTLDEGIFRGQFVDRLTIQGSYTNVARGESHPVKLIESGSPELRELRPASIPEPGGQVSSLSADLSKPVNLRLDFTTKYGDNSFQHTVNFGYGPYEYGDRDHGSYEVVSGQNFYWVNPISGGGAVTYFRGYSTVASMSFYPDWLLLEGWDQTAPRTERPIFSMELPWDSLLTLDASKLASGSEATELISADNGWFSEYCEVSQLKLSYIPSPSADLDASIFRYEPGIPPFRNVVVGGNVYQVPCNTIKLLEYLDFEVPFQR